MDNPQEKLTMANARRLISKAMVLKLCMKPTFVHTSHLNLRGALTLALKERHWLQYAGQGPYAFSSPCWTCGGDLSGPPNWKCNFDRYGQYVQLGHSNNAVTASTTVDLLGGTRFQLTYSLSFFGSRPPNMWLATIGSIDNSFPPILVDSYVDVPWQRGASNVRYSLEQGFTVPAGTRAVTLTFTARLVRP